MAHDPALRTASLKHTHCAGQYQLCSLPAARAPPDGCMRQQKGLTLCCSGRPPHTACQLAWACRSEVPEVGPQHDLHSCRHMLCRPWR